LVGPQRRGVGVVWVGESVRWGGCDVVAEGDGKCYEAEDGSGNDSPALCNAPEKAGKGLALRLATARCCGR
jgi:hypothetical protein